MLISVRISQVFNMHLSCFSLMTSMLYFFVIFLDIAELKHVLWKESTK